jgi:hypothetical protein
MKLMYLISPTSLCHMERVLYMVAASVHTDKPGLSHLLQQPWWKGDQNINIVNEFTWLIVPGPGTGKHHLDTQTGLAGDVLYHVSHGVAHLRPGQRTMAR